MTRGKRNEKEKQVPGYQGMNSVEYIICGEPLQSPLPRHNRPFDEDESDNDGEQRDRLMFNNEFKRYASAYRRAGQLLSLRPWKTFAPFEGLKVTLHKRHMFADENVKIIHFCSHATEGGDNRSDSPGGWMEIFDDPKRLLQSFWPHEYVYHVGYDLNRDSGSRLGIYRTHIGCTLQLDSPAGAFV